MNEIVEWIKGIIVFFLWIIMISAVVLAIMNPAFVLLAIACGFAIYGYGKFVRDVGKDVVDHVKKRRE